MQGKFRAKAKTWDLGETSTGKEQVAVEFQILTEGAEYSTITWYGYFTEDTWQRTIESLRYMGWKGENLEDLSGLDANEVELEVGEEEYQGKTQTKVKWVNRAGGLNLKAPLSPERKKSFAAQMSQKIRALDASQGNRKPSQNGVKPPAARPEPPPHTDNDFNVPF